MALNIQKGNMYGFVNYTWNTVKGKCIHDCGYCYMKTWGEQKPIRFDESELKTYLGNDNFIFVGSSNDLFANNIPDEWIDKTLKHCEKFSNRYLFQSKNPGRFNDWYFPADTILATTIESNINYDVSNAPLVVDRIREMANLEHQRKMITIEPILDFNLAEFINIINHIDPFLVAIGANTSKKCDLRYIEPHKNKILSLIKELRESGINVFEKDNLKRLIK